MTAEHAEHEPSKSSSPNGDFAPQVRSQALCAGIAACAMLYFGFTTEPISDDLSVQLLKYTLVCGGVAMAASTMLLLTGALPALLFDGISAMAIGIALVLSGLLWFGYIKNADLNGILELVFGYLFFTSGRRNYRDYFLLRTPPADSLPSPSPDELHG